VQAALLGQTLAAVADRVAHHLSVLIAAQPVVAAVLVALQVSHQTRI
tara:strand:- start:148 stop:288 length:141 start_codon:yes stop_codon:yes gene_type:complete